MKRVVIVVFVLLLLNSFPVLGDACSVFCEEEGYDTGVCRKTTESKGFCEGKEEDVYGFSECTDFKRCCCRNGGLEETAIEENVSEENRNGVTGEVVAEDSVSAAEDFFIPLIVLVALLALGVILKKKIFREETQEEEKKEEEAKE